MRSADRAKEINQQHELAVAAMDASINHAIRCGELLIDQKRRCGHGKFQDWVKSHCTFSHDTANMYMRAAKAKTSGLVFSSLRELVERQRRGKETARERPRCLFPPDPEKHRLPPGHDAQAWAEFVAVANYLFAVSKQIEKLDGVAIGKGARVEDMRKLRPHLRRLHVFIGELRSVDSRLEWGLPLNPDSVDDDMLTLHRDPRCELSHGKPSMAPEAPITEAVNAVAH